MSRVLLVGCGETGRRVAKLEQEAGNQVLALVRTISSVEKLHALEIPTLQMDLDQTADWKDEWNDDWVYYFVPPSSEGLIVNDSRLERFLKNCSPAKKPSKILLCSTTGIYGNCDGRWITEDTPPNPQTLRAKRRFSEESFFWSKSQQLDFAAILLRVAAIYHHNRLPLEKIRQRQPVLPLDMAPWSNRIHQDDLAQICFLAMRHGKRNTIYNVSDGVPLRMTDYFFQIADHFRIPRPPELPLSKARLYWSAELRSYWEESKRLDNRRLLTDLPIQLRYPNLQSALNTRIG